jgi:hypothetical protein
MSPTFYQQIFSNILSPKKYMQTQTVGGEKLFKILPCKKKLLENVGEIVVFNSLFTAK